VSRGRGPRRLAEALPEVLSRAAPATPLAAVQAVWADAVGKRVAAEARPVEERDGVITVACASATWAQELDLLSGELLERLREALPEGAAPESLRFTAMDPGTPPFSA
jgi:predicted nucleic acid-binding Zn ribbon protein